MNDEDTIAQLHSEISSLQTQLSQANGEIIRLTNLINEFFNAVRKQRDTMHKRKWLGITW